MSIVEKEIIMRLLTFLNLNVVRIGIIALAMFLLSYAGCTFEVHAKPPLTTNVVEYYHPYFDHYFITSNVDEIHLLDQNPDWTRTGESFRAFDIQDFAFPNSYNNGHKINPMCRFFSIGFDPLSSHFYTNAASECGDLKMQVIYVPASPPSWLGGLQPNPFPRWQYEGINFSLYAHKAGYCPNDSVVTSKPLYRLYNNGIGGAPNHRYTTEMHIVTEMRNRGWVLEGVSAFHYGGSPGSYSWYDEPIFACVPIN
jgi:hypothetical protein